MSVHGSEHIEKALGKHLTAARRHVLGLGRSNDAFGHGVTELDFENVRLVIRPGPNEDYLVIEESPFDANRLDREYWTSVDLMREYAWHSEGRLQYVDIFTDGIEDVALVFRFDSGDRFSLVLRDTDAAVGRELELFEVGCNKIVPAFRTRIEG